MITIDCKVPGTVIHHSPAASRRFIGSPSIAVLPNGDYVASHDYFGESSPDTIVYRSGDQGLTWRRVAKIEGQWWSNLFVHNEQLFLFGTTREYGFAAIRWSSDGGVTWTRPIDAENGLLLAEGRYACAPCPVVQYRGRLWRAMEDAMGPGGWGPHFRIFMMSAPVDSDLLDARSWTRSKPLESCADWLDSKFGGWLEGNAVVMPGGGIGILARVDYRTGDERAALITVSESGCEASFDPLNSFVRFPGGCKKFTVRHDPVSDLYWSLSNYVPLQHRNGNCERTRNTVALVCSSDLRKWTIRSIVLYHSDVKNHGFQYLDWLFEADDLIAVSRTAYDDGMGGADNQHNANFLTFHRVRNFRGHDAAEAFNAGGEARLAQV